MTLNETMSMTAADALAKRLEKEGGTQDTSRIAYGFQLCTARQPTARELKVLLDLLKRQQQNSGEVPPLAVVARVLLNLDETITKE